MKEMRGEWERGGGEGEWERKGGCVRGVIALINAGGCWHTTNTRRVFDSRWRISAGSWLISAVTCVTNLHFPVVQNYVRREDEVWASISNSATNYFQRLQVMLVYPVRGVRLPRFLAPIRLATFDGCRNFHSICIASSEHLRRFINSSWIPYWVTFLMIVSAFIHCDFGTFKTPRHITPRITAVLLKIIGCELKQNC